MTKNETPAERAQKRLNEIELLYPRIQSRNPRSETVMESDAEYLARNPQIDAAEFRKLGRQLFEAS